MKYLESSYSLKVTYIIPLSIGWQVDMQLALFTYFFVFNFTNQVFYHWVHVYSKL